MVVSYRMVVGYDGADKISVDMADATGTVLATKTSSREGDSANFFNNSYQAVASKVEWTSDAGNKITMKLGIGVNAKTGATLEDAEKIKLGQIATPVNYVTSQIPLDTSCEALGAGTYNLIGNYTGSHPFSGYRRGLCCRMADGTGSGDGGSLPGMVQAQTGGSIT